MRTYYKVVCDEGAQMAGAGLGYDEIYGSKPRFFWNRRSAQERCLELNDITNSHNGAGTFSVEEGHVYDDGSWDDSDDAYAREQLGLSELAAAD